MNALLQKADFAGLIKVTLFSANDMKKPQKFFRFILDISPLDFCKNLLKRVLPSLSDFKAKRKPLKSYVYTLRVLIPLFSFTIL